jgi:hypothetical protein
MLCRLHVSSFFTFCWPCISVQFLLITNLTHFLDLFHFCTCFEQPSAHHQENQLYQYIIWNVSLLCLLTGIPFSHLHRVAYTRWCIAIVVSPDYEHWVARNM